jgi:hypothetical protein
MSRHEQGNRVEAVAVVMLVVLEVSLYFTSFLYPCVDS